MSLITTSICSETVAGIHWKCETVQGVPNGMVDTEGGQEIRGNEGHS